MLLWAWSIPVLIATQFAMLAIIPVLVVLRRSWRDPVLRPVRAWAAALAATYATPLVLWAVLPDPQRSLSRDIHPLLAAAVMAVAAAYAIRLHLLRARRGRR